MIDEKASSIAQSIIPFPMIAEKASFIAQSISQLPA